jgi:hypothetical protein
MEILTFVIEGRAEVERQPVSSPPLAGPRPGEQGDETDKLISVQLNRQADEIASTMEREIRRLMLLGGGITVQADVWFRPGASFILEGSVVLLSWAGRTALEPIQEELANVIKTVTRRVLNRVVSTVSDFTVYAPTIEVAPLPPTRPETTPAPTSTPSLTPASTQQQAPLPGTILQDQRWLIVVVGILGVLVLILLADRILPRNVISCRLHRHLQLPNNPNKRSEQCV